MTSPLVRHRSLIVAALLSALAACKDSTSPPQPAAVANGLIVVPAGTVGAVLGASPTFVVKDGGGNVLTGIPVTVTVTAGGGILTNAPVKTLNGETPIGTWQLGTVAGINSVTVSVAGVAPFVISVTGNPGPPTQIVFTSGQGQNGLAGTTLTGAISVQVKDQFGNAVVATPVTFTVADGGGVLSGTNVNTDNSGNATSPQWTLGKSANAQTLRAATIAGASTTLSATVKTAYNIDLRFFGPALSQAAAAAFTNAAARISGAVIGDVPDWPAEPFNIADYCGLPGLPTDFNQPIDDLVIFASVVPIDGPGSILGAAGPCAIRDGLGAANQQTLFGVMQFDAADIDVMSSAGILQDVIQHEMLHVVGIGTLWSFYGLLADAGTPSVRFTGALGVGACIQITAASVCPSSVPVENCEGISGCGDGTRDSHWRELVFGQELMTGYITSPRPGLFPPLNPFSLISIQSLADIGYQTNPAAADPYVVPGTSALRSALQAGPGIPRGKWESVMGPRVAVNRVGRVFKLPARQ
jgi:hypothetical protein